ncbi:protein-methionine-sulfoxide reductase heme-binding subunit MsrQ [Alteromonadaceae bacterium BrNp21-10]|nr:protein-methionine-sulfoxide reductase heme-binding subunit MsrQ [Alteromonadaceae bacterium BrNp21-10]
MLKVIIHLCALWPLVWLYTQAFNDGLGADPVKYVIHFTGIGALNILLITLCISPIAKYFRQGYLLNVRRLLGLYVFFYACLHLTNFIVFDLQFDWPLLWGEIIERPYITVGMAALLLLLALSVTSPMAIRKRMGANWQKLHNWIYLVVLLVCTHFIWSVKSDITEPLIYFAMAFVLLWFRKDKAWRFIKFFGKHRKPQNGIKTTPKS